MKKKYQHISTALFAIVKTRLFVMWVVVCLASNLCFATTFDVAADFSAANNPNGVWSYGWSSELTSALNLYPNNYKDEYGLDVWWTAQNLPSVGHNGTVSAITDDINGITWEPGQFSLHPGGNGEYSHARWTAPDAGTFDIDAVFTGIDEDGVTTDVHVLHNGFSLFDGLVNGYGDASSSSFSTTVSVDMGDTIDFAVGDGGNWLVNDSTALSATIVPEPATLLVFGLGGLAVMRKRRA